MIERWTNLTHKIATGSSRVRRIVAPMSGVSYVGLIAICVLLSSIVDRWLNLPNGLSYPLNLIAGLFVIAGGLLLFCLSVGHFLRARGTPVAFSPPPKLVSTGPYRFARNPMLTGIFIQLFGIGVAMGSLSLTFIFTPLFIIVNIWEVKKVEEPELEKRLGEPYVKYKGDVPMFLPIPSIKRLMGKGRENERR